METMNDLISRQAAIDALNTVYNEWQTLEACSALEEATSMIEGLPSAQPELFTDEEQRRFLSAMRREEHICKHVDAVYEDPYEKGLVRICHEITRKVKGALWT